MKKSLFIAIFCIMFGLFGLFTMREGNAYQTEGNVVKFTTNYYSLYPVAGDDNSKLLVTWYCGQEYAATVSSGTPRNAQLTVVFDDCGNASDLQGYCIIDCIFTG